PMSLALVDCGPCWAGSCLRTRGRNADLHLVAVKPDQLARAHLLRTIEMENERGTAPLHAYGQDDASTLLALLLGGPQQQVVVLVFIRRAQAGVRLVQCSDGYYVAQNSAEDGMRHLTMQGKAAFGSLLEVVLGGAVCAVLAGWQVHILASRPD